MALDAFALILAMLLLGMAFRRLGVFGDAAAETLNQVVLYVCLPAAVLRYAPQLGFDLSLLGLIAVPWLLLALTVPWVAWLARRLGLRRDERAVLLLTTALGNTSFLGFPLVHALLGEAALPYAVVYDQFGSFLILSSFGLYVLARYGDHSRHPASRGTSPSLDVGGREPTVADIGRRIVRFPPFLALVFGLTLMPAEPPAWIAGGLQRLADALLPLVVLAIGITIRLKLPRDELKPLVAGLAGKLVLMPLLAFALTWPLGLRGTLAQAAVLEAAMPPMITAAALAISHRLAPGLAAALVGYGILLSLFTLPAWTWLLTRVFA
ncbi:MAG: AEC family transporter [Hyphomonas sp.]